VESCDIGQLPLRRLKRIAQSNVGVAVLMKLDRCIACVNDPTRDTQFHTNLKDAMVTLTAYGSRDDDVATYNAIVAMLETLGQFVNAFLKRRQSIHVSKRNPKWCLHDCSL
jgi:hypothetical protein